MYFQFGKKLFLLLLLISLSGCFGGGVDKRGSVIGYRKGVVKTEGGHFRVGILPSTWKRKKLSYRAILFTNKIHNSSIGVDAFCKGSFDDAPLNVLTNQLFYGMTDQKKPVQKDVVLDGREALRTTIKGKIDGADVVLDVVVLKMNECVFDFQYVSRPDDYKEGVSDFETFYGGFQYIKGPRID